MSGAVAAGIAGLQLQLLPQSGLLESIPDPFTPVGIAIYVAGLLGLGGVRYLLKRWRRSNAGTSVDVSDLLGQEAVSQSGPGTAVRTATPEEGSDRVIKQTAHGHGKKKDVAFTLPGFLPLSEGIRNVTHDEIHAVELGFVVGLLTAWLRSIGRTDLTVTILAVFVAGTLGYKRYRSKAFKTVRYEPWYALIAFAIGAGVGYLLFVVRIDPLLIATAIP